MHEHASARAAVETMIRSRDLEGLLRHAETIHGHRCPFLALGVKAGVPLKALYDVINESSGQSRSMQIYAAAKAFKGDYEPGFAAELMHKDLGLALNLGKEERVPLPLGALSHQIFTHLLTLGLGKKDTGVIFKVMEDLLNVKIRF